MEKLTLRRDGLPGKRRKLISLGERLVAEKHLNRVHPSPPTFRFTPAPSYVTLHTCSSKKLTFSALICVLGVSFLVNVVGTDMTKNIP